MEDADPRQPIPCDEVKSARGTHRGCGVGPFREHNRMLVGYLRSRLGSEQEAKEVAEDAYVRVLQLHQPGAPGLLRAYLFKLRPILPLIVCGIAGYGSAPKSSRSYSKN